VILADTSVWVDHLRSDHPEFADRLDADEILMHPFVVGELMLSGLKSDVLGYLRGLPSAMIATAEEVAALILAHPLGGRGIGYVDSALLASARLARGTKLWTHDRRLFAVASEMSIAFDP
jgi:predicted nucleic acid-binding protein